MAAALFHLKPVFKTIIEDFFNKSIGIVRNASKKSSRGVGKSNHGRPSHLGIKKGNNAVVKAGTILYNQNKLVFMPGLNVGIGKIAKLYAKVPGRVKVTAENTNFKPDNKIVELSFPDFPPAYRKYMHVIPEPQSIRFKIVEKFYEKSVNFFNFHLSNPLHHATEFHKFLKH